MRLVCVTPHVPHPDLPHAGGVLLHHRLRAMGEHADIAVLAPHTQHNADVAARVTDWPVLLPPGRVSGPSKARTAGELLGAALGRLDSAVPPLRRQLALPDVAALLTQQDVVEVHWGDYLPLLPVVARVAPQAARGIFLHDVLTEARAARRRNPLVWTPERAAFLIGSRPAARQEQRLLRSADVTFVLKQQDAERLSAVRSRVLVAQPWLQLPEPVPGPASTPVATFVAALWREENATAALWLTQRVWPRVRQSVPGAELRLVGDRPTPELVAAADAGSGIVVTGFVDDLDGEYRRARVALAPLTSDTGLKVKVPQAMAYGLPVVARPEAVAGVADAPPGVLGGVQSEPQAFADAVAALLVDEDRARRTGLAARSWVERRFDFEADAQRAVEAYQQVLDGRLTRPEPPS
jgi:glycosyltransferase involved in cell wall biosynthesis